ncbi:hypothetical protein Tco_0206412 [Tanacetum coccineum]
MMRMNLIPLDGHGMASMYGLQKAYEATRKVGPLPIALHGPKMLERLTGNQYYLLFPRVASRLVFRSQSTQKNKKRQTFTCPYETFAYRACLVGYANAPGNFARCNDAIFHDMIEKTMNIMDDFSVFRDSFSTCLSHLKKMLKRCEDTNFVFKLGEEPFYGEGRHLYAFEKFRSISCYVPKDSVILTISVIKNLFAQKDAKARLISGGKFLMLQEFDIEIREPKRTENPRRHLSRLENPHQDKLENKEINVANLIETPWSGAHQDQDPMVCRFCKLPCEEIRDRTLCSGQEALDILKAIHSGPTQTLWRKSCPPGRHKLDDLYGPSAQLTKTLIGSLRKPLCMKGNDFPDCEDSHARSIHMSFTSSALLGNPFQI